MDSARDKIGIKASVLSRKHRVVARAALIFVVLASIVAVVGVASPSNTQTNDCTPTDPVSKKATIPVNVTEGPVQNSIRLEVPHGRVENSEFWIELPVQAQFYEAKGFKKYGREGDHFVVDLSSSSHTLVYTYNNSTPSENTSLDFDAAPFEDEKNWTIAPLPPDYGGVVSYTSPDEAVFGQQTVYFGDYTMKTVANSCHRIRLVVPKETKFQKNETAILRSMLYADQKLAGVRPSRITFFASPENFTDYEGIARDADIVMSQKASLGQRRHVWHHEYVHTRQVLAPEGQMEWWKESEANYLGLRLAYQSGYLSERSYNDILNRYRKRAPENVSLANTSSWRNFSTYSKGTLVLADLDARLRNQTNGNVTIYDVHREIHSRDSITLENFTQMLSKKSGVDYSPWIQKYVVGTDLPPPRLFETSQNTPLLIVAAAIIVVFLIAVDHVSEDNILGQAVRSIPGVPAASTDLEPDEDVFNQLYAIAEESDQEMGEIAEEALAIGVEELAENQNEED